VDCCLVDCFWAVLPDVVLVASGVAIGVMVVTAGARLKGVSPPFSFFQVDFVNN
jgi:hypothetical protein